MERLDKLLAATGRWSRREVKQLVRQGQVLVNGFPAASAEEKYDPASAAFTVCGQPLTLRRYTYVLLHKPAGVLTATEDRRQPTVLELLPPELRRIDLAPVGRLDKDTEGLLLLTNDGDFANLMMHPSHGVSKLYRVTVRPRATEEQVVALSQGVELDDGTRTQPAVINVVTDEPERTVLEMTIREGKNREIRRMCEAVGLDVIRLRRNAMGAVKLGMLQPGEYRELTKSELNALRAAGIRGVSRPKPEEAAKKPARRPAEGAKRGPRAAGSRPGARPTGRPGSGKGPARGPKKPGGPRG